MFSNINEVWGKKDPVRQISEKISKGILPNKDPYHEIFQMPKSQKESHNEKIIPLQNATIDDNERKDPEPTDQSYDLASDSKYSLLSDTDLGPIGDEKRINNSNELHRIINSPLDYSKEHHRIQNSPKPVLKKKKKDNNANFDMLTSEDVSMSLTDWKVDSDDEPSSAISALERSKCSKVAHHLKKCNRCSKKLKKLINNKLNAKYKDLLIDKHITHTSAQQLQPVASVPAFSDSFKETLLIVVAAIIVIFILFLIAKSFSK